MPGPEPKLGAYKKHSFRSSILLEILVSLGLILIISIAATSLLEAQLAGSAFTRQSRNLAAGRLGILAEGYRDRERLLDINLRAIAERLDAETLIQPGKRNALIAELARTSNTLQMDLLQMIGEDSQVAAAIRSINPTDVPIIRQIETTGRSGLIQSVEGPTVQVLAVPVGVSGNVLVGGYDFSDAFAYQMRTQIGGEGQTVLVAGGRVVGTTLPQSLAEIPGRTKGSMFLPSAPIAVTDADGERALVAYVSIGTSARPSVAGALGILLQDPVATLNRSLVRVRIVSSLFLTIVGLGMGWVLFRRVIRPLVGISETAGRIAAGDFDSGFSAPRGDEIGRLAVSLTRMTSEMQAKTTRLQEASKRLVGAQERERRRVARDLHDGMQQQLVALAIKLRQAAADPEPFSHKTLNDLADDAEDAAFALQELGRGISPTVLADQGLYAALRAAAGRLPMHVILEVAPELEDARFDADIESTVYYVALEAMTNAQKHAPNSTLTIGLKIMDGDLVLNVIDDGPGFHLASVQAGEGAGLQNMRDRISAQGGDIVLLSGPTVGTTIACTVPLSSAGSADGGALPEIDEDGSNPAV